MFLDEQRRTYIDHMRIEHRRLHKLLSEMRIAIDSGEEPGATAPPFCHVIRVLRQLGEELKHHFAEEEAGGCLEEAVCHCPRLSAEAKQILAEHPAILAQVNGLIEHAQSLPANEMNQLVMGQELNQLRRRLQSHEAAENRLLSRGFGIDANDTTRKDAVED